MRPVIDLHQDLRLYCEHPEEYREDRLSSTFVPQTGFAQLQKGNVRLTSVTGFAVPPSHDFFDPVSMDLLEEDFAWYQEYVSQHPEWSIVRSGEDVSRTIRGETWGLLLHIEGFNTFTGSPSDWERIEKWHGMGLRSIGAAWNFTNSITGGTNDTETGLTEVGKKFVAWLEAKNMICDAAHMSRPAFFDLARASTRPLYVSHGNADAICSDLRNYTDEQLQAIAKSDGVIGVFFSRKFLVKEGEIASLESVIRHVEYIRTTIGITHVALGTDFGGITSGVPHDLPSIAMIGKLLDALHERGWDEKDIDALAYGNAERILKAHLGV